MDIAALLAARARIAHRPGAEIIDVLDGVIADWLAPQSELRRNAEAALAAHTGFAPAMLRDGLPRLLAPLRGDALRRLLEEEVGGDVVDGPRLIAHILPGNVPALAASAICQSLAIRAATLVKPGRDEQVFAPLFAASIAARDADLGACVAVRYWPGGAREVEDVVCARADVVDATGGDEAIAALRARVRGRFVGRGARLSFALIGRDVVADAAALSRAAGALAEDIAIWDQRGCLSPQVVLAESGQAADLERVAEALAGALEEIARRWPPRALSLDEKASVLRFRQSAEWGLSAVQARLLEGNGLTWTIALEDAPVLRPTCLHRTVRLQPLADVAALDALISPVRRQVECAGVAAEPACFGALERSLRAAGVHRVCAAGEMQRPDLGWKPGGIPRIAAWLEAR